MGARAGLAQLLRGVPKPPGTLSEARCHDECPPRQFAEAVLSAAAADAADDSPEMVSSQVHGRSELRSIAATSHEGCAVGIQGRADRSPCPLQARCHERVVAAASPSACFLSGDRGSLQGGYGYELEVGKTEGCRRCDFWGCELAS